MKSIVLLAFGLVGILLFSGFGAAGAAAVTSVSAQDSSGTHGTPRAPPGAQTASNAIKATLSIASVAQAINISSAFWGTNIAASYPFDSTNASQLSKTPVTYLRFPGGGLGEEFNYTSSTFTNDQGTSFPANTSTTAFVNSCRAINCSAILQLPAEINSSATAAYYASYVVHTLGFQPAYWEIGDAVPGWTHYNVTWASWGTVHGSPINASLFAQLVGRYISAIRQVDSVARFIALGSGMGQAGYDQQYVSELALMDGKNLSGISVHSYVMGTAPFSPTWPELLSNLNGKYSLPVQVAADRSDILTACPSCQISLFVTEANAAEVNNYSALNSVFAGTLYVAAETAQGLNLQLSNLDWFCFDCNFSGSWQGHYNQGTMQFTLFDQMFPNLGSKFLVSNLTGTSSLYAAATYGSQGLSLLLVNVNMTQTYSLNLAHTGIISGSSAVRDRWENGNAKPHVSSITLGKSLTVPPLSIEVITVAPSGVVGGVPAGRGGIDTPIFGGALHVSAPTISALAGAGNPPGLAATVGPARWANSDLLPRRMVEH
jgi:hypothetical protein